MISYDTNPCPAKSIPSNRHAMRWELLGALVASMFDIFSWSAKQFLNQMWASFRTTSYCQIVLHDNPYFPGNWSTPSIPKYCHYRCRLYPPSMGHPGMTFQNNQPGAVSDGQLRFAKERWQTFASIGSSDNKWMGHGSGIFSRLMEDFGYGKQSEDLMGVYLRSISIH